MIRLQRRRAAIEHIRVPLLCHQTNLPFVAVFMRSGRRVWFDHTAVTNQGRSPTGSAMDLDPPRVLDLFPMLPWQGVRCPHCGAEVA